MDFVVGDAQPVAKPPPLTIAISTLGSRVCEIDPVALPASDSWRYMILVQADAAAAMPAAPGRSDIDWLMLDSIGVAASRNRAIAAATTEYLLFSDDDVRLLPEGIAAFIATFEAHPDAAIVTGQTLRRDMAPLKPYAARAHQLSLFNSAKTGTVEMMVRPARVRQAGIAFNTAFGAGAAYPFGDEYLFIAACLKAGLMGRYISVPVAVHRGASSGGDWSTPLSAETRGRVLDLVFGPLALPIKLAFVARHAGKFRSPGQFACYCRAMLKRTARS